MTEESGSTNTDTKKHKMRPFYINVNMELLLLKKKRAKRSASQGSQQRLQPHWDLAPTHSLQSFKWKHFQFLLWQWWFKAELKTVLTSSETEYSHLSSPPAIHLLSDAFEILLLRWFK
jgi:hypothetical protein